MSDEAPFSGQSAVPEACGGDRVCRREAMTDGRDGDVSAASSRVLPGGGHEGTWHAKKQRLLSDFAAWLDQLEDLPPRARVEEPPEARAPDLFSFYGELAALRRDAQLQAKTLQGVGDGISELGDSLVGQVREQGRFITDAAASLRRELPRIRREAQADSVSALIELVEGLTRCTSRIMGRRPPGIFLTRARYAQLVDAWREPVKLLTAKARDALGRLGVRPIAAVGDSFDRRVMRAVEAVETGDVPSGHVQEIVRQGYMLREDVLQVAEVKVAR